jgi:hypothetical protein
MQITDLARVFHTDEAIETIVAISTTIISEMIR